MTGRPVRVLIVDPHDGVRRGIGTALAISEGIEVIEPAGAAPDVVLVVAHDGDCGDSVRALRQARRRAGVIVLATDLTEAVRAEALAAGAAAVLHTYIDRDQLIDVIRTVAATTVRDEEDEPWSPA